MDEQQRDELCLVVLLCGILVAAIAGVAWALEPLRRGEVGEPVLLVDDGCDTEEGSVRCTPTLELDSGINLEGPLSREQLADIVGVRSEKYREKRNR